MRHNTLSVSGSVCVSADGSRAGVGVGEGVWLCIFGGV
jgi:hypothetical protein